MGTMILLGAACSSVTTPVLKHETGETLGQGKAKGGIRVETGRMVPIFPSTMGLAGIEQTASVFTGQIVAIQGAVGIINKLDLGVGSFMSLGGGGWRVYTKFQALGAPAMGSKSGNFSVAALAGFGRYSSSGSVTYQTSNAGKTEPTTSKQTSGIKTAVAETSQLELGPGEVQQILSASCFEFSAPVSYRLFDRVALYSGIHLYYIMVSGAANLVGLSDSVFDYGSNFGIKAYLGRFEVSAESAMINATDPFLGTSRFLPYFGVATAFLF